MIPSTALNDSQQEDTMVWLTSMQRNWIGFAYLGEYLSYGIHVLWLFLPLILVYPVPFILYFLASTTNLLLYIYMKKNNLQWDISSKSLDKARQAVVYFVTLFAKIWHGYEIIGMEHLPEGPGLIIYYHGAPSIDYACFIATLYREKRRYCYSLTERILTWMPGVQLVLVLTGCGDRNKAQCVEILKKGEFLGIAPGGLREQNFSNNNYTLVWGNRIGFAQVALEAKVVSDFSEPIIPMFTQNLREGYFTIGNTRCNPNHPKPTFKHWHVLHPAVGGQSWEPLQALTRWLYEQTRCLVLPIYGGFPVKLRSYIGEPIPYDPNITAKELAEKTKTALENLINQHQKKPGNTMRALTERFDKHHKLI